MIRAGDYRTTYIDSRGTAHEAIQLPWDVVIRILGREHDGSAADDASVVDTLLRSGAPEWVRTAEGWTDDHGWGLIGPALESKEAKEMRNKLTWQVIEDNGGGLYLAVFEGDDLIYYADQYEYSPDALREAVEVLRDGGDPRTEGWDLPQWIIDGDHDINAVYDDLTSHEHGWQIVADQDGIYYDRMGSAAERVFMVPWQDLALFDRDNQDVTDADEIRTALHEFRETGAMLGYFFRRIGWPHEDEDDASTWGPPSPERVNWDGFDG